MRTLLSVLILLGLINYSASGQSSATGDPRISIVPHGPEVSAMAKFIDMPVSLSTGIPNVSVPVYKLQLKNLTVPVSLDYHASGVKVDEVAPNTGLGWALNAGGSVSQSINGLNDFGDKSGWLGTKNKTPQKGLLKSFFGEGTTPVYTDDPSYTFNLEATKGLLDTEPDVFYFSMPGKSGKFFFDQSGIAHLMPYQKIKVFYSAGEMPSYTLTDEMGNVYLYSLYEVTGSKVISTCASPAFNQASLSAMLTKITTVTGETVTFTYENIVYSYDGQLSQTRSIRTGGTNDCASDSFCQSTTVNTVSSQRLSEITSSDGQRIKFNYSTIERLDLKGTNPLSEIVVYHNANIIQKHQLNFDYFTAGIPSANVLLNKRLKLTSVVKNGLETYSFEYDSTPLPPRLSFAQDHWGGYNGASENTKLLSVNLAKGFNEGANREVNPQYVKAGTLKKITYPTGGYTALDLEANTYYYYGNLSTVIQDGIYSMPSSEEMVVTNFTIPPSGRAFKVRYKVANKNQSITLTGSNNFKQIFTGTSSGIIDANLLPGTYTLSFTYKTDPSDLSDDFIQFSWVYDKLDVISENRATGGLRVKNIEFNPGSTGNAFSQHYTYTKTPDSELSSGELMYQPTDVYESKTRLLNSGDGPSGFCSYNTQSSSSVAPLGSIQGGNITYDNVHVYTTDKIGSGLTSTQFINEGRPTLEPDDLHLTGVKFPFATRVPNDWINGLPKRTSIYKFDNSLKKLKLISVNEKSYKTAIGEGPNESFVRGAKIAVLDPAPCTNTGCGPVTFAVDYYYLNSSWSYLTKETDSTFSDSGSPIVKTTLYHYDNPLHIQLTRTETVQSDGKYSFSSISYPDDYLTGTSFIDDMKVNNQVILPIENVRYIRDASGEKIISGQLTRYYSGGKGLLEKSYKLKAGEPISSAGFKFSSLPAGKLPGAGSISAFLPDDRYEEWLSYENYDAKGNPLSVSENGATRTVYIWSYNKKYPVAEIKNTDYATVQSILTVAAIETFASSYPTDINIINAFVKPLLDKLSNVQITTFSYKPSVGILAKTDPKGMKTSYEYDEFQRLKNVKDQNGNIIKNNTYNYTN